MSIESTIEDGDVVEKPFPKLMISESRCVAIMTSPREGTVVKVGDGGAWCVGYFSDSWGESCYKDFNGKITLQNK